MRRKPVRDGRPQEAPAPPDPGGPTFAWGRPFFFRHAPRAAVTMPLRRARPSCQTATLLEMPPRWFLLVYA
ncbi:MAG: hypothetical protein R2712_00375, partial [Vicinamibacterales bacterium]